MSGPDDFTITPLIEVVKAWNAGGQVGKYVLLGRLATGGMAEIWLARQDGPHGFQKIVVIKKIVDSYSSDPEFVQMFLDEARIAAQLSHPNVVQVFDLGEHEGSWFIVMEYLAGEDAATLFRALRTETSSDFTLAAHVVAGAADGLAYAHELIAPQGEPLSIVHRDISPNNLFITYEGQIKVLDFGIARAVTRATKTSAGKVKGKFAYMSPEQAMGADDLDARSDVFSLGVVLFEMLTHERFHSQKDEVAAVRVLLGTDPLPAPIDRNSAIPRDLSDIVARALAKDRAQRTPSARALAAELRRWLATAGESSNVVRATMLKHFGERMRERQRLIDSAARQGELTPRTREELKPVSASSMPGNTLARARPANRWAIGALLTLLTAAIGVGAGVRLATSRADEPLSPVVESRAVDAGFDAGVLAPIATVRTDTMPPRSEPPPKPSIEKTDRPAPRKQTGRLTLQTMPWTRVLMGNRVLGETPLIEVQVPAGRLLLRLVNEAKKIDRVVEVEVSPGKLTTKKLEL